MTMEIRGTLWRKYGHDRTYLADELGTRLGWVDNKTGTLTVDVEEHRDLLTGLGRREPSRLGGPR